MYVSCIIEALTLDSLFCSKYFKWLSYIICTSSSLSHIQYHSLFKKTKLLAFIQQVLVLLHLALAITLIGWKLGLILTGRLCWQKGICVGGHWVGNIWGIDGQKTELTKKIVKCSIMSHLWLGIVSGWYHVQIVDVCLIVYSMIGQHISSQHSFIMGMFSHDCHCTADIAL
jgi:hypothetical protein